MRVLCLLLCAVLLAGCNGTSSSTPSPTPSSTSPASSSTAGPQSANSIQLESDRSSSSGKEDRRRSRRARPAENSQPGIFDFYLLTLSWSPEFCATHPGSQECAARPGFVAHGLWPQNNDGTYPENCSTAAGPSNPAQYTNLIPTVSLIKHEWATHGTCSGLAPDAFFGEVGKAFHQVRIPVTFVNTSQPFMLSPSAIIGQFAAANPGLPSASIALSCGNNYLTAVEICLSKTLEPEDCQNVRTCGATVVKVTPQ